MPISNILKIIRLSLRLNETKSNKNVGQCLLSATEAYHSFVPNVLPLTNCSTVLNVANYTVIAKKIML